MSLRDKTLEEKIDYLLQEILELKEDSAELKRINAAQSIKIDELTSAWNTAKGIVAIIRWTAAVSAGLATAWAATKGLKL